MLYPIFVNLDQKRCVVVGAGKIAERRIRGLLEHGANVKIIAPSATDSLIGLAEAGMLVWHRESYRSIHLAGALLVVAATDDPAVNAAIAEDAAGNNQLICRADEADGGNYVTGASITRGSLQISLTTGGASPTLAAVIKDRLGSLFGGDWGVWTELFAQLRSVVQSYGTETARRDVVMKILDDESVGSLVKSGRLEEAKKAALLCILSHSD